MWNLKEMEKPRNGLYYIFIYQLIVTDFSILIVSDLNLFLKIGLLSEYTIKLWKIWVNIGTYIEFLKLILQKNKKLKKKRWVIIKLCGEVLRSYVPSYKNRWPPINHRKKNLLWQNHFPVALDVIARTLRLS